MVALVVVAKAQMIYLLFYWITAKAYCMRLAQCRSVYCGPDYVRFIVADINPICSYNGINT